MQEILSYHDGGLEALLFLESYVVAVCLFEEIDGVAHLRRLEGTAFFIGGKGMFVTARHVLSAAQDRANRENLQIGLVVKGDNGTNSANEVARIYQTEFAPPPFDIAVGTTTYRPAPVLHFKPQQISPWQEVATLGYPQSALSQEGEALWMNVRAQKGYVQRTTLPRDAAIGTHPNGIELSFLLGAGMSGAPVFTIPDENLIGVAVGSNRSEIMEDSIIEVDENGQSFRETRLKIESHGFAHDVNGLVNWRIDIFGGRTFLQMAER